MRIPGREGEASLGGVHLPETVNIAGVDDALDRAEADLAAAEPHERAKAMRQLRVVENFAGCQRVEVADEKVRTVLMLLDRLEKRLEFNRAPMLGPGRVHRAQMQSEDPQPIVFQRDLEECV